MSWFPADEDDDKLFLSPIDSNIPKDKFWNHLLIGIFVALAILVVCVLLQAAF